MIEDKLTHDERLRLECVAQAVAAQGMTSQRSSAEGLLDNARKFEAFIKGDGDAAKTDS